MSFKQRVQQLETENKLLKEQNLAQQLIINELTLRVKEFEGIANKVKHLEDIQSKNSTNSSKPPSSDGLKRTKSMRQPSGKPAGGQQGHAGHFLEMAEVVDKREIHKVVMCRGCGADLSGTNVSGYKNRQVADIPPIKVEITEHQAEIKSCPCCQTVNMASFPDRVTQPIQYGDNIRQLVIYMLNFMLTPVGRTATFLRDFFGIHMSEGTIINIQNECASNLEEFKEQLKTALGQQPILHLDETGYYFGNLRQWLHVTATKDLTLYETHQKRGKEAMDAIGILPGYQGVAVHDYWKSYMEYNCNHSLCNAHHLRDLTFCAEQEKSEWASLMIGLLLLIKTQVDNAKDNNLACLDMPQLQAFQQQYNQLITAGKEQHPLPQKQPGKRGKPKQTKTQNMIQRFDELPNSVLGFMYDFRIPFDNNQAEQDIRMMKVKQKISGCFRSTEGAEAFATIRSYISTMRKQGQSLIEALLAAVKGHPKILQIFDHPAVLTG